MIILRRLGCLAVLIGSVLGKPLFAQDDVADVPSRDLRIDNDEHKRYFLIGPNRGEKTPEEGLGLIVVLPGGDGSVDFNPFVKRIFKNSIPDGYVVAQPVAVMWTTKQAIVWPTAKSSAPRMKFTTEEFVNAVIDDVAKQQKLNPKRIFTLSWASSGPAAYAISTSKGKVTGSFIAMSVFHSADLTLANAKGQAYYLYHSPDDRVIPFKMVEQAAKSLEGAGAKVKLAKYEGGMGWHGDMYSDISQGIDWLERNTEK